MQIQKKVVGVWVAITLLVIALIVQVTYGMANPAYAEDDNVDAINGNELLVFKVDRNVTVNDRGFPRDDPPMDSANGNWHAPINYAEGTFYFRIQVRSQPQPQNMRIQFCAWQDSFELESCATMGNVSGNAGTVVTWSQPVQDIWKKNNIGVDWHRPRQRYGWAIKNTQGQPVSNYNGWNWNGENPNHWYPLDMCAMVVVVAKGSSFSGWNNYHCSGNGGGGNPTVTPTPTRPSNNPTATPTPTDPGDPPQPGEGTIYLSSSTGGRVGNLRFADEDILAYDNATNQWWMVFDGSDVGVKVDLNGFTFLNDGSLLFTINKPATIAGIGTVDDSDIVRFVPSKLGSTTAGSFSLYFDGSDVGLEANGEDLDVINLLPDGSLLLSTLGNIRVNNFVVRDEDLVRFVPTSLGNDTAGSWGLYFDGSAVGLTTGQEDVWAAHMDTAADQLYLSTSGDFAVPGLSGSGDDIFVCNVSQLGNQTACQFSAFWNGNANNFGGELIDGMYLGTGPQLTLNTASTVDDELEVAELYDELDDDILEDENGEELILDQTIYIPLLLR